jgi:hypothetical protein
MFSGKGNSFLIHTHGAHIRQQLSKCKTMILSSFDYLNSYKLTMSSTGFLHDSTTDKGVFSNQENSDDAQPTIEQLEEIRDAMNVLQNQYTQLEDRLIKQQKEFDYHISRLNKELVAKISRSRLDG